MGPGLMENRHGLLVDACLRQADGMPNGWRRCTWSNPMVGRWRIVEADLWDRDHPDLVDPATITIEAGNHGEIAFRPVMASISAMAPIWYSSHGPASTNGRGHWRGSC